MRPTIAWPDGKKIACLITVAFEAFEKSGKYKHDPEVKVNFTALSHSHFGGRVGVWRLMEIFQHYDVKATFLVNGKAAELWPQAAKAIADAGHELAGYGYTSEIPAWTMTAERQLEDIRRTRDLIQRSAGVKPVGWVSPGDVFTPHTLDLLAQEGFIWNGDPADDDNPYLVSVKGKRLCIIPDLDCGDDFSAWEGGLMCGDDFFQGFQTTFDYLYQDALRGKSVMLAPLVHAELGGRPNIAYALTKMIRYAREFGDLVWFPTRRQVAEHCLKSGKTAETFHPAV